MLWSSQWSHVPFPATGISAVSAAPDGGFWALLTAGESADAAPTLARYAAGAWRGFPGLPDLQTVAATPQGGVCGIDASKASLICLEPTGRVSSTYVGVTGELGIAPDGSLWVAHQGSVARLPWTVPGAAPTRES
jgi:hypothetical protein